MSEAKLTEEQKDVLFNNGIDPADFTQDLDKFAENLTDITVFWRKDNFENFIERTNEVSENLRKFTEIIEKYQNPALRTILEEKTAYTPDKREKIEELLNLPSRVHHTLSDPENAKKLYARFDKTELTKALENLTNAGETFSETSKKTDELNYIDTKQKNQNIIEAINNEEKKSAADNNGPLTPIEQLKQDYQRVQELPYATDLTPEKIQGIYEKFLTDYKKIISEYMPDGHLKKKQDKTLYESIREQIDHKVGIPPHIFPDKGIHYHEVIAEQIKKLADKAENLDVSNMSEDEINQNKYELYNAAVELFPPANQYEPIFNIDLEKIEMLAGYEKRYLLESGNRIYNTMTNQDPVNQAVPQQSNLIDEPVTDSGTAANDANLGYDHNTNIGHHVKPKPSYNNTP